MVKPRAYGEVYNDRWGAVVRLFKVLRDIPRAVELERQLRLTPFARDEFDDTYIGRGAEVPDDIEHSRQMILRSFAGFGSAASNPRHKTGFRANSNRSGTTPAHDWANYPDLLPAFTARLQGVTIENRDASDVMMQHDGLETLHYVDPPYVHDTRSAGRKRRSEYEFEMTDEQHTALLETLKSLKGMVILSGYRTALYDDSLKGWSSTFFGARADGALLREEVLWFNPAAWERHPLWT